jgi:hypothetical protein
MIHNSFRVPFTITIFSFLLKKNRFSFVKLGTARTTTAIKIPSEDEPEDEPQNEPEAEPELTTPKRSYRKRGKNKCSK